jgi:hypothetical protein
MPLSNEVVLRPRFKIELNRSNEKALETFDAAKKAQKDFIISRVDDHVFIRFPKEKQHFWSPQLHLEINEVDENSSLLHGLFGPNPTVWSMFMFLHFFVAVVFIGFGAWAYSNWSLDNPYGLQIGIMILMVVFWFALYFAGRLGKKKGKPEMHDLHDFMKKSLNIK